MAPIGGTVSLAAVDHAGEAKHRVSGLAGVVIGDIDGTSIPVDGVAAGSGRSCQEIERPQLEGPVSSTEGACPLGRTPMSQGPIGRAPDDDASVGAKVGFAIVDGAVVAAGADHVNRRPRLWGGAASARPRGRRQHPGRRRACRGRRRRCHRRWRPCQTLSRPCRGRRPPNRSRAPLSELQQGGVARTQDTPDGQPRPTRALARPERADRPGFLTARWERTERLTLLISG